MIDSVLIIQKQFWIHHTSRWLLTFKKSSSYVKGKIAMTNVEKLKNKFSNLKPDAKSYSKVVIMLIWQHIAIIILKILFEFPFCFFGYTRGGLKHIFLSEIFIKLKRCVTLFKNVITFEKFDLKYRVACLIFFHLITITRRCTFDQY